MRYRPPRRARKVRQSDPFVRFTAYIPLSLYNKLKVLSEKLGRPSTRFVSWALLNELQNEERPFANKLKVELPEKDYVQGNHQHEASVLYMLLKRIPTGAGLDTLIMLADDLGLSETQLLLGYMELKNMDKIEEYYPRSSKFPYPEYYRYIRIKEIKHREMLKDALVAYEGSSVLWSVKK